MAALGDFLRSHREASGTTLEDIAARTRISVTQLGALEAERFELLPGGVFNVSFVRQFARCVGADEQEAVDRLKHASDQNSPALFVQLPGANRDEFLVQGTGSRLREILDNFFRENGGGLASVAIGLLLLVGGVYSYQLWEVKRAAEPMRAAQPEPPAAPLVAAPKRAEPAAPAAAERPTAPIQLDLRIVDIVWISAQADGEPIFARIFQPGEEEPIYAEEQVMLRVGNAGGVELALNGEPLPPLGPTGGVRRVKVTESGMEILNRPSRPAESKSSAPPQPAPAASPTVAARQPEAELASSEAGR